MPFSGAPTAAGEAADMMTTSHATTVVARMSCVRNSEAM